MYRLFDEIMSRVFGDAWAPMLRRLHVEARDFSRRIAWHRQFERAIIVLIIFNAIILGLQTDPAFVRSYGALAERIDRLILAIFVFEIGLRVFAHGRAFFRNGWSWFDVTVVALSFVPATEGLAILRSLRVLRLLRLLSVVPKMRRVIGGFFAAIPGMAGVVGVLSVLFYVSAVITTTAFGQASLDVAAPGATQDDIDMVRELFGTLKASFYTLFQLMTLEDWSGGIVKPTLAVYPDAMWFFGPYIVLTSFAVLNLFIGIIVDAMQDEREDDMHPLTPFAPESAYPDEPRPPSPVYGPTGVRPAAAAAGSSNGNGDRNGSTTDAIDAETADMLLTEIRRLRAETRRLADLAESARADANRMMAARGDREAERF